MPFHFPDGDCNWLTNAQLDPYSRIPEYKVCAVRIEKIPDEEAYTADGVYITQAMVARKLGCTQSALSKKITAMSFSLEELRIVFRELGFSDKEILESMRKES